MLSLYLMFFHSSLDVQHRRSGKRLLSCLYSLAAVFFYSANGRGARTPEGLDAGSRHPTSSTRRGSQNRGGLARPAQNPFAFVSFDYSQLDRRKEGATSTAVSIFFYSNINAWSNFIEAGIASSMLGY